MEIPVKRLRRARGLHRLFDLLFSPVAKIRFPSPLDLCTQRILRDLRHLCRAGRVDLALDRARQPRKRRRSLLQEVDLSLVVRQIVFRADALEREHHVFLTRIQQRRKRFAAVCLDKFIRVFCAGDL